MKKILALTMALGLMFVLAACGGAASSTSTPPADSGSAAGSSSVAEPAGEGAELKMGQVEAAPHGTRSFAITTAVVDGDTIVLAYITEYQFMSAETTTGVPNSDQADGFAAGYAEDVVLGSKRVNSESYSANMAENGGSTISIADNLDAVQNFVAGKTIAELEELVAKEAEEVVDAVADCTLVDAKGYLQSVIDAAKAAQGNPGVQYDGDVAALKLGFVEGAAHGTRSFTVAAALTDGETIVMAYIDEFQFMSAETTTGVPNSDQAEGFAAGYAEDVVLGSKRVNSESYSANMSENGGATISLEDNFDAVQAFAAGKTIAELQELTAKEAEEVVDAVADCTLVDAKGYIDVIVAAAQAA